MAAAPPVEPLLSSPSSSADASSSATALRSVGAAAASFMNPFGRVLASALAAASAGRGVLLAGVGGGYDVFAGLPLYFELASFIPHHKLHLSNFSFTSGLNLRPGRQVTEDCLEVRYCDPVQSAHDLEYHPSRGHPANYFPEYHLSKWFHTAHNIDKPVYTLAITSTQKVAAAYRQIIAENNIGVAILIDAGVDSIFRGDEEYMGTYQEDVITVAAFSMIDNVEKYLVCSILGSEGGVGEYHFLENVAAIQKMGGFFGSTSITRDMPSVKQYEDAVMNCIPTNTTINVQLISALHGEYGHFLHPEIASRCSKSDLYITPLMTIYWLFDLTTVVKYRLFIEEVCNARGLNDVTTIFCKGRLAIGLVEPYSSDFTGKRLYNSMFTF
ncbi:cell surface glycoprotein [Pelomyxa schiedti]|nr:cell surface glycoprotein [Pelomyxa schiedti]